MTDALDVVRVYTDLIKDRLDDMRRQVKGLGLLTGELHILPPLDTGGLVEVLFRVMDKAECLEVMTAWFTDADPPELTRVDAGW